MIRRTLSALAIAASLVPFSPAIGTAHAEAAPQHTQVPGYYRMALGNLEITALYDGSTRAHISTEVTYEDGRKGRIEGDAEIVDMKTYPAAKAALKEAAE